MKEKMMVKSIVVFDFEQFQEALIKNLIVNNISYVQIDNEFHFLDKIYRIYDFNDVKDMFMQEPNKPFAVCAESDKMFLTSDIGTPEVSQKKGVSYTKKLIREDNRRANARFKGSVSPKVNNFRRF